MQKLPYAALVLSVALGCDGGVISKADPESGHDSGSADVDTVDVSLDKHRDADNSRDDGVDVRLDSKAVDKVSDSGTPDGCDGGCEIDDQQDAPADSGLDVDGSISTADIIGIAQGTACEACAERSCMDAGSCEGLVGQVADAGAGAGTSLQQLCYDTLSCVLNSVTACYDLGTLDVCYCGVQLLPACEMSGPTSGAICATQEANGSETTDPTIVVQRFYDGAFASGTANNLATCMLDNCEECLP